MQNLKSKFITVYLTTIFLFLILNIQKYFEWGHEFEWIVGAAIQAIPLGFIAKLFLVRTPRTTVHLPILSGILLALLVAVAIHIDFDQTMFKQPIMYSLFTVIGWFIYINWYSFLPKKNNQILKAGNEFPNLGFIRSDGSKANTAEFAGKKSLYMFYRGNWCPLCMAQIREVSEQYKALADLGVQIVLISPQPQKHTQKLASKFDVPFIFLSDPKNESAKKLALEHPSGTPMGMEMFGYSSDTVLPTVIITDEQGKIIFADLTDNYRLRPEPYTFLKVINDHNEKSQ
jgi:peroxiredoxin